MGQFIQFIQYLLQEESSIGTSITQQHLSLIRESDFYDSINRQIRNSCTFESRQLNLLSSENRAGLIIILVNTRLKMNLQTSSVLILTILASFNLLCTSQINTKVSCLTCVKGCDGDGLPGGTKCLVYQNSRGLDETCIGSNTCPSQYTDAQGENVKLTRWVQSCQLSGCGSGCCVQPNQNNLTGQTCLAFIDLDNSVFCDGLESGVIAGIMVGTIISFFVILGIAMCVCSSYCSEPEDEDLKKIVDSQQKVGAQTQVQQMRN